MASSSKRLANHISFIAFSIYFSIIIFQVPIFRVACRKGIYKSPLELTTSQLIDSEVVPHFIVKTLLYPGALAKAILKQRSIPSYRNVLKLYNFNTRTIYPVSDLQRIEVLVGSYFAVGGAINGLIRVKPGRMGFSGMLLLMWGLIRELIFNEARGIQIYSMMYIALVSAFFSIKKDVRKIIRSFTKQKGF